MVLLSLPSFSSTIDPFTHLSKKMPVDYEKQDYWRDRFAQETAFEWLLTSAQFMSIIDPQLSKMDPSSRILHLGSGTSDLQNHLRQRGFTNVINADYEPLAVQRGQDLEQRAFGDVKTKYAVADATCLPQGLPNTEYDLVIDKSTVDAVSCGGSEAFLRMAKGIRGCLKENTTWISLSYSQYRFDVEDLPFEVDVLAKVPAPKLKETDPDIYYWCYQLQPA